MPVRQVGKDCYQWGNQKKYCGPNAKKKAILQGIAIENTGWKEAENWGRVKSYQYVRDETRGCYPCPDCGNPMSETNSGTFGYYCACYKCGANYITKPLNAEEERCCRDCNVTTGLTTIQTGTYCYKCLPINLGAEDDYTKTYGEKQGTIRRKLKNKIMKQAIMGTKAGQWSARKSQELKRQYEVACEKKGLAPYKGKKTSAQKDLTSWTKQDWTTKSGKPSSKTGERYLPKKAIKALTDKEYKKTSSKKRKDSKKGKQFSKQPSGIAKKVAQYRAEIESKPYRVVISRSTNDAKKLMAVFYDGEDKKVKTTHFGARGSSDYTKHGDKERMERYLERHGGGFETSTKENWKDPMTAGALSRWILWNKPDLGRSFKDYLRRFNLKGELKVSKSAETGIEKFGATTKEDFLSVTQGVTERKLHWVPIFCGMGLAFLTFRNR